MSALIKAFLDEASSTYTYVLHETDDGPCAIIDSVLNYDPASGRTDTRQAGHRVHRVCHQHSPSRIPE